jgi:hypothetical protein
MIPSQFWCLRYLSVLVFCMGFLNGFYVEAKVFELLVKEERYVLRIVKRSRGVSRIVFKCARSVWSG